MCEQVLYKPNRMYEYWQMCVEVCVFKIFFFHNQNKQKAHQKASCDSFYYYKLLLRGCNVCCCSCSHFMPVYIALLSLSGACCIVDVLVCVVVVVQLQPFSSCSNLLHFYLHLQFMGKANKQVTQKYASVLRSKNFEF